MDQLVITLEEIKKKPSQERIPLACCSFSRFVFMTLNTKITDRLTFDLL